MNPYLLRYKILLTRELLTEIISRISDPNFVLPRSAIAFELKLNWRGKANFNIGLKFSEQLGLRHLIIGGQRQSYLGVDQFYRAFSLSKCPCRRNRCDAESKSWPSRM